MINSLYEKFRHWSSTGAVWIISDLHLGDPDCKIIDPDWIEPEKQIDIINLYAHKGDTFVCLGDVGDVEYIKYIKAKYKVLIMGNHDTGIQKYREYFDEVYDGPLMISKKIMLSHEPVYSNVWLNIHGHNHEGVIYNVSNYGVNLAANICGFKPMNLGNFIKEGGIVNIDDIHRFTIDVAAERKIKRG